MKDRMKVGEKVEAVVVDFAEGNQSIAKLETGEVILLNHVAVVPGEKVEIEIKKIKKNFMEGTVLKSITKSQSRIQPQCYVFGICGGCKLQHVHYAFQANWKQKKIIDTLNKIGGLAHVPFTEFRKAEKQFNYRNKIEFSFSNQRFILKDEPDHAKKDFALGFHPRNSFKKVIDIDDCDLAPSGCRVILNAVKEFARQTPLNAYNVITHEGFWRHLVIRYSEFEKGFLVNVVTSSFDLIVMNELHQHLLSRVKEENIITLVNGINQTKSTTAISGQQHIVFGHGVIYEMLDDIKFRISSESFFQTNTTQAKELYQLAIQMAELKATDIVYDICCGAGTISLLIAKYCRQVLGIDNSESAIQDASYNAKLARDINNCFFERLDMKDFSKHYSELVKKYGKADIVIVDPPRVGLHPNTLEGIKLIKPEKLIYVSCNPATLARDIKELIATEVYIIDNVKGIDMFPQTSHVECIVKLLRI